MNNKITAKYDVVVVGGGIAGLTLACALAKQTNLSIAVLESQNSGQKVDSGSPYEPRVSAISLASQRILQSLDVWNDIKACRISPFKSIYVWDAAQQADIRFDSKEIAAPCLGYIIENQVINQSLLAKAASYPSISLYYGEQLESIEEGEDVVSCKTRSGKLFSARLLAGADGARSTLRELAGIKIEVKDYNQCGLVSNVETELAHNSIAQQVFLPNGPLAFLPLNQRNLSSIVWSLPKEEAEAKLELSEQGFMQELAQAFSHRLGEVKSFSKRYAFPLSLRKAEKYVKHRVALLGDAAHVVHPLAGQGVNMGFLDAASLAEVIVDAIYKRRDYASLASLRRYERWRKADNQGLLFGVDWLKSFFAKEQVSAQKLRGMGLNLTSQLPAIKKLFVQHAVGNRAFLPALAISENAV